MSSPAVVLRLSHDTSAPSAARRFLGTHSVGCVPDMIEDAQLLASELVAAAARQWGVLLREPGPGKCVWFLLDAADYR